MILVTGATGFIGSELTRQLVAGGAQVRILRRATSALDLLGDVAGLVEHAEGDVTEPASLLRAMEGVAQVYHTAAVGGFGGRRDRERRRIRLGPEAAWFVVETDLPASAPLVWDYLNEPERKRHLLRMWIAVSDARRRARAPARCARDERGRPGGRQL